MNKRRRVLSIILGVCISLMMVGTAFADETNNPYTTSVDTGTYTKGSMKDQVITVNLETSHGSQIYNLQLISVKLGNTALKYEDDFTVGDGISFTHPTSDYVWPSPDPEAKIISGKVIIKSSYLEKLSAGSHDFKLNLQGPVGSATATINVVDTAASPSASPSVDPSKTPAAGTTEATTTPSKDANGKNPQTGDDTSGIMGFAVAAILSGAALVVLGRKKVFK